MHSLSKQPVTTLADSPKLLVRQKLAKPKKLRVLIAPSGFKECLGADEVADCIEEGLRRVLDEDSAVFRKTPLHDGGEGFCKALVAVHGGEIRELRVTGPDHKPVDSHFGVIGDDRKTAVLDMAAAAGLRLVPKECRDPTLTTTYGVGELIVTALDAGCTKIIIGCGDSGTSDGGAGMLQALGVRLMDKNGDDLQLGGGGGTLSQLETISLEGLHPRLRDPGHDVKIEAVCNIKNILCGPQGVARVYGPQKGATEDQVETLSLALEKFAQAAMPILKEDLSLKPGSGASGGLGAGLMLLRASLRARGEAIDDYFMLKTLFEEHWDIVITAEGSLDFQSSKGKMTVEIARRAQEHGAQVIALAGTIGHGAETVYDAGVCAFLSILEGPASLEEAIKDADRLLKDAAEKSMRVIKMGMSLQQNEPVSASIRTAPEKGSGRPPSFPYLVKMARAMTG
ncbi:glycerate kinase [Pseudomassariella vexata]|uniref:Glycerate kinase n=1 Tax=Pseudomassariella vexata TaxID=1141098 RepID=A0A1Y2D9D9_9PEZI|nr:glycerate kinase [Pseudomassariella vexata]ORY55890.1 glycerate kinase [Pseudomassariella vexata]